MASTPTGGSGAGDAGMQEAPDWLPVLDARVPDAVVAPRLRRPRPPPDIILRPRLTALILEGLAGPLTLICAPAGFGKTVALTAAVEYIPWPVAWVTHTSADSSLTVFVGRFVAAIQQYYPQACHSTLSLLQLPKVPSPTSIAEVLEHDLNALPDDCVVVLDDYHTIDSAEVDALLAARLLRLPPQVHLVVASRTAPAWPLASLRAAGLLVEVGAEQLRFTRRETRVFLSRAARIPVDEPTTATIHEQMGGWAAAIRLAALALRQPTATPDALPSLVQRAEPHAIQYLLEEIVAKQPPPVADFLVRTAICERISASLADALLAEPVGSSDGTAVLQQLEQAGLFVTREDGAGDWYRYHDLFRAALERRLRQHNSAAQIRSLHSRASAWFAREGLVEAAVRHALLADESEVAAAIVEAHVSAAFARHEWGQVAAWLELLPTELVAARPDLLLADGWIAHRRLQYGRLVTILERVRAWLDGHGQRLPPRRVQAIEAEIDALWAAFCLHYGDAQRAFEHAQDAWERLPASAAHARGQAGCSLGMAAQILGRPDVVDSLLASDQGVHLRAYPAATLHVQLAVLNKQFASGDFVAAEQTANYLVSRAQELHLAFIAAWAHYLAGRIYYEWDQLDATARHYTAVVDLRHNAPAYTLRAALQGLAIIDAVLGHFLVATEPIAQLLSLREGPCYVEAEIAAAFNARLALSRGEREAAFEWLHTTPPQPGTANAIALVVPAITRVELLLAEGSPADVEAAAREVAPLVDTYLARHDSLHGVKLLVLQALAAEARGDEALALAALERAVRLAMPGKFVRSFVDRGPAVARLLAKLPPRDDTREYVDRLRAACKARDRRAEPLPHREAMLPDLTEPLTARELEVLDLLARRFSNKEVATTLHVSWQTVAKHTNNIYQKLRVTGRRDAVDRAAALGILPDPPDKAADA